MVVGASSVGKYERSDYFWKPPKRSNKRKIKKEKKIVKKSLTNQERLQKAREYSRNIKKPPLRKKQPK
jgi:hypothetical protein